MAGQGIGVGLSDRFIALSLLPQCQSLNLKLGPHQPRIKWITGLFPLWQTDPRVSWPLNSIQCRE